MADNFTFESWGRYPKVCHAGEIIPKSIDKVKDIINSVDLQILPRGQGRSYGDSCINEGGYLLSTKMLDKFHAFDNKTGILRCESGVTLDEILKVFVPKGWFLPITPGTKFVTVGGAIANDIHGKNHHKSGSFGNNVIRFELQRSDKTRLICSRNENADWFKATIGGLGLTGVILWAEFALKPILGPYLEVEYIKFGNLDEFSQISKDSEHNYEYTVSWLDCFSTGGIGRGIFMRGNHSYKIENNASRILHNNPKWKTFPCEAPPSLLSTPTVKAFNFFYYNKQIKKYQRKHIHYNPFFYPLDGINRWNRMYGERGFLQWQCVVPATERNETIKSILKEISISGLGSFLVVLKEFGDIKSEGVLSFPLHGITLALDFPNTGRALFSLLDRLDEIVCNAKGRLYPAKDARMSSKTFRMSFPLFNQFVSYIDPKISSSFYRRVIGND